MSNRNTSTYHSVMLKYLLRFSNSLKHVSEEHVKLKVKADGAFHPVQVGYVCPLCLRSFFIIHDSRVYTNAEFTEDHYPPKCVGGKRKVLVCKECNNGAGITYDYAIKEYLQVLSFAQGHHLAEIPVKSKYHDITGNYRTSLIMQGKNTIVHQYSSKNAPFVKHWLENSVKQSGWKIDVSFTCPSEAHVRRAILRSAYLYCFNVFGYGFAYSVIAKHLRAVIKGDEQHSLSNQGVFIHNKDVPLRLGLHLLHAPKECSCYIVNMMLSLKESGYNSLANVLIPLGHYKDSSSLAPFRDVILGKKDITCKFTQIDDEDLMKKKMYNAYYSDITDKL